MPFAWDRKDLERQGALHASSYSSWRPIPKHAAAHHPVFTENPFNTAQLLPATISHRVHRRLERALSLATNLITVHSCLDWWATLMFGRIRRQTRESDGRKVSVFETQQQQQQQPAPTEDGDGNGNGNNGNGNDAALRQVRENLLFAATKVRWEWAPLAASIGGRNTPPGDGDDDRAVVIEVNDRYMRYLAGLEEDPEETGIGIDQFLRVSFRLASVLVHELAHAVFTQRALEDYYYYDFSSHHHHHHHWLRVPGEQEEKEFPRFDVDEWQVEHGCSWEVWMFGGKPTHIGPRFDCADGLSLEPWISWQAHWARVAEGQDIGRAIDMHWIRDVFTVDFWAEVVVHGRDLLKPVVTGATAQSDMFVDESGSPHFNEMQQLHTALTGVYGQQVAVDAWNIVTEWNEEQMAAMREEQEDHYRSRMRP